MTKQKRPLGRLDCRRGVYYQPILGKQTIPRLEYQVYLWGRRGRRREKRKEEIANFSLPLAPTKRADTEILPRMTSRLW